MYHFGLNLSLTPVHAFSHKPLDGKCSDDYKHTALSWSLMIGSTNCKCYFKNLSAITTTSTFNDIANIFHCQARPLSILKTLRTSCSVLLMAAILTQSRMLGLGLLLGVRIKFDSHTDG